MSALNPTPPLLSRFNQESTSFGALAPSDYALNPLNPNSKIAFQIISPILDLLKDYYAHPEKVSIQNVDWIQCLPISVNSDDSSDPLYFRLDPAQGINIHTNLFKATCSTQEIEPSALYKCEVTTRGKNNYSLTYTALIKENGTLSSFVKEHQKGFDFSHSSDVFWNPALNASTFYLKHVKTSPEFKAWSKDPLGLLHGHLYTTKDPQLLPFSRALLPPPNAPTPTPSPKKDNPNTDYSGETPPLPSNKGEIYLAALAVSAAVIGGAAWLFRNKDNPEENKTPIMERNPASRK